MIGARLRVSLARRQQSMILSCCNQLHNIPTSDDALCCSGHVVDGIRGWCAGESCGEDYRNMR
jgi:hypothetical protein